MYFIAFYFNVNLIKNVFRENGWIILIRAWDSGWENRGNI